MLCISSVVNQIMWNLRREHTLWLLLEAAEVEGDSDRMSHDPMTSSASANRTPHVLPVCTWMTLWLQNLKTLQPRLGFCPPNAPQRAPPNHPPEDCSLETEGEQPSTARLAFSLHHSLRVYCSLVGNPRHTYIVRNEHMLPSSNIALKIC